MILKDHFRIGLNYDARVPLNVPGLEQSRNQRPCEHGLVTFPTFASGITGLPSASWPFPQVFVKDEVRLAVGPDYLYAIDSSDAAQQVAVYNANASGSEHLSENSFATVVNWTAGTNWAFGGGNATKTTGASGTVTQAAGGLAVAFQSTKIYKIIVSITSVVTDGQFRVKLGSSVSDWYDARVEDKEIVLAGAVGDFVIEGDSDSGFVVASISVKEIAKYNSDDLGLTSTSKPFHLVTFNEVWFLTNGSLTLYHAPASGNVGATSPLTWRVTAVPASTLKLGCLESYGGRMYASGFNSADAHYSTSEWDELWELWLKTTKEQLTYQDFEINKNVVFCSAQAASDPWWTFSQELAAFGIPDSGQLTDVMPFARDALRKGLWTFLRMPFKGETLRLVQFSDGLVAFGQDGVAVIKGTLTEHGYMHQIHKIANVGLGDKGAVIRAQGRLLFLDTKGKIREIDPNWVVKQVKFNELFSSFITNAATNPVIANYDDNEEDAYFGNGLKCYVFTPTGCGERTLIPTSIYTYEDGTFGVTVDLTGADTKERVITNPFDGEERMLKNLHMIDLGYHDLSSVRVRLHYQMEGSTTWRKSPWILKYEGGFVIPQNTGMAFKVELEYDAGSSGRLEYLKFYWQHHDQRNFREHQRRGY